VSLPQTPSQTIGPFFAVAEDGGFRFDICLQGEGETPFLAL
jgi:hypothetical protein